MTQLGVTKWVRGAKFLVPAVLGGSVLLSLSVRAQSVNTPQSSGALEPADIRLEVPVDPLTDPVWRGEWQPPMLYADGFVFAPLPPRVVVELAGKIVALTGI